MSSKKQITIDPATLSGGQTGHNVTMKRQRKIKPPAAPLRHNDVKRNLLEKIKDFKRHNEETPLQGQEQPAQTSMSNNQLANQFKMSTNYLEQLINKKKEARKSHKPKTPKQQPVMQMQPVQPVMQMQPVQPVMQMQPVQPVVQMQPVQPVVQMQPVQPVVQMQPIEVSLDLPPELQPIPFHSFYPKLIAPIVQEEPVITLPPYEEPHTPAPSGNPNPFVLKDVPYGCLRNGNKPTYRTYHRKMQPEPNPSHHNTMKKSHSFASPNPISFNPISDPEEDTMIQERQRKLRELQEKAVATNAINAINATNTINGPHTNEGNAINAINAINSNPRIKNRIKTTTTKKYKLGRTPGSNVVGVLIKNNETRSRVTNDLGELKRESIVEVRKYLHDHGLLKVGSDAPPDVLRNMYETAKLTGEVNNVNKQVLLHNFVATADKEHA